MSRSGKFQDGFAIPTLLSFIIAATIILLAVMSVIFTNLTVVSSNIQSQKAFNIAEAGLNYYLWHLSHNSADFKDGLTTPATPDATLGYGPYVHNYIDDNGINQGTYTLWLNPQGTGSTMVTVRSIGKVAGTNKTRTVQAQIGAPSFASYALVADAALWFGNTESADGPVHSNVGIRMDGASNGDVTSANSTYVPPGSLGGDGGSHPGVWCSNSVTAPINCSTRSKTDWRYPVPQVDFNQIAGSLCTIKKAAFLSDSSTSSLATGASPCTQVPTARTASYLPQRSNKGTYNAAKGYLIQLNTNGTYDLSQVDGETDTSTPYTSALTLTSVATGITIPSSGVIFAEDNVWVRTNPTYHGRVTIAAGRLATSSEANIVIADDILYTTKNGNDAIGMVAEGDVLIAPYAPPANGNFTFEVDAALLSQANSVTYPNTYRSDSSSCTRGWVGGSQLFNFYGSVGTRQTWTWTWLHGSNNCGDAANDPSAGYISGIEHNSTSYDYNMLYAPPPSFPITGGFNILSWREILTAP